MYCKVSSTVIREAVEPRVGWLDYQKLSVVRTLTSSKEGQVFKTLSVAWITIARNIVGVIVVRVAAARATVLPTSNIRFHQGGSLHANGSTFQPRGLPDLPDRITVGGAPCVSEGLRFWDGQYFFRIEPSLTAVVEELVQPSEGH